MLDNQICVIQLPTHAVRITRDHRGRMHCFKHDRGQCDFDIFEAEDQDAASDYILESLPTVQYRVSFPDDIQ